MSEVKETAVAKREERAPVQMDERGVSLRTMDDLARFSVAVCKSELAPKGLNTPEKVLVAVQTGMEAGLSPMAAMRSLYVISGMPAWYGKAAKALILNSGRCTGWDQGMTGSGDAREAWVESQRIGLPGIKRTTFSVADAKRMRLWGKEGPWTQDPDRMLTWRAIGRHCADWYHDVLMGLALAEEVEDYAKPAQVRAISVVRDDTPDPVCDVPAIADADAEPPEGALSSDR